jgi:ribose transport system permease protein
MSDNRICPRAKQMRRQRITQQGIVFGIFVLLYIGFSLFLPGFLNADTTIALLRNVAVLGILSLGMAIVIIGRGIDLSMIAMLAVSPGLVLQMVENGHSVAEAFAAAVALAIGCGLIPGGRAGVLSAVIGTLLIGTILNAMTILDVSYSY